MTASTTSPDRLRRRRVLLLGLLLVCLAGAAVWANLWKGDLRVSSIVVRGNSIVSEREILALAAIRRETKLFDVDLFAARARIEQNPFIRSVSVNRDVPYRITIDVEEREPVAAVAGEGLLYLDAAGFLLPHTLSAHIFDIPLLTGETRRGELRPGRPVGDADIRSALALLATARRFDEALYRRISEVHLDGDGEMTLYTAEAGVPVRFGSGEVTAKLAKFDAFWHTYVDHRGAAALEYIDLRFEDQVVVRWRQRVADPSPS